MSKTLAATTAVALLSLAGHALAVPPGVSTHAVEGAEANAAATYWTPERLRAAVPLDMRLAGPRIVPHAHRLGGVAPSGVPGAAPSVAFDAAEAVQLFEPDLAKGYKGHLVGSLNQPFTTNRLIPTGTNLQKDYPYEIAGQLFFSINGSPYLCSGSVVRARIVATAGHCVSDGNGNFYSNWLFVPAENNGKAPFKSWSATSATVTNNWHFGGGVVPNVQDDAVLVMADQPYHGATRRIGDVTGYLGYEYNAALPTAVTQIGWPCNLDSCADPISTSAQLYTGPSNNFTWGTAQTGGSSGGPEIQDFGQAPSGMPAEILGGNVLVSVTSFYYTNPGVYGEGGSIFGAPGQFSGGTFGDLLNVVCATGGNC